MRGVWFGEIERRGVWFGKIDRSRLLYSNDNEEIEINKEPSYSEKNTDKQMFTNSIL